jgi:hypothetical protein
LSIIPAKGLFLVPLPSASAFHGHNGHAPATTINILEA